MDLTVWAIFSGRPDVALRPTGTSERGEGPGCCGFSRAGGRAAERCTARPARRGTAQPGVVRRDDVLACKPFSVIAVAAREIRTGGVSPMTENVPARPVQTLRAGSPAAGDPLEAALRAAQRLLSRLE